MAAVHSEVNQDWLFGFCWNFFWGIKLYIPVRTHSDSRSAVLEAECLKKGEKRASAIEDLKLSQSTLGIEKIFHRTCLSGDAFGLASIMTLTSEWSDVPTGLRGDYSKISARHFSGKDMRKRSRNVLSPHERSWVLQWYALDRRPWRYLWRICFLHQFSLSELTTLCSESWSHHKYERYQREIPREYYQ